jgi:hypothetical protein
MGMRITTTLPPRVLVSAGLRNCLLDAQVMGMRAKLHPLRGTVFCCSASFFGRRTSDVQTATKQCMMLWYVNERGFTTSTQSGKSRKLYT